MKSKLGEIIREKGVAGACYVTDPDYATKLISVMRKWGLVQAASDMVN